MDVKVKEKELVDEKALKVEQFQPERALPSEPSVPESGQREIAARSAFVDQQQMHLANSLRFADTKAGALIGVCGLVLPQTLFLLESEIMLQKILYIFALILIAVGILISFLVVLPTSKNSKAKGSVYWEHIQNYTQQEFMAQVKTMNNEQFMDYWLENNYIQSVILTRKFRYLSYSFKCCLCAFLLSIASFIVPYMM